MNWCYWRNCLMEKFTIKRRGILALRVNCRGLWMPSEVGWLGTGGQIVILPQFLCEMEKLVVIKSPLRVVLSFNWLGNRACYHCVSNSTSLKNVHLWANRGWCHSDINSESTSLLPLRDCHGRPRTFSLTLLCDLSFSSESEGIRVGTGF